MTTPRAVTKARKHARANVPAVLRVLMRHQALTVIDLAALLGVARQTLSARVTGRTAIDAEDLAAFALVLGVPVGVFFGPPDEAVRYLLDHPPTPR